MIEDDMHALAVHLSRKVIYWRRRGRLLRDMTDPRKVAAATYCEQRAKAHEEDVGALARQVMRRLEPP